MAEDQDVEVVQDMPLTMQARAALLANLTRMQELITTEIDKVKKALIEEAGDREFVPVTQDSYKVSIVRRRPPSKPDVVGLIKAGHKKEEFGTVSVTLTSLQKYADKQKWTDRQLQKFILPGEGSPVTYVRCEHQEESE
jgi:hypothetical protein